MHVHGLCKKKKTEYSQQSHYTALHINQIYCGTSLKNFESITISFEKHFIEDYLYCECIDTLLYPKLLNIGTKAWTSFTFAILQASSHRAVQHSN